MKISRKSWHFIVYYKFYEEDPHTLCEYIWKYFMLIALTSVVVVFFIGVLLIMIVAPIQDWTSPSAILGYVIWTIVLGIFVSKMSEGKYNIKKTLLYQRLKAFKDKSCPIIEIED